MATSSKSSGKRAIFYIKNCVINNTQQDLTFYYSQPNERQIKSKNYKEMVAGSHEERSITGSKKFFMLSDVNNSF